MHYLPRFISILSWILTPYPVPDNHISLDIRIGYEGYTSITAYYSSFKQDTECKGTRNRVL